MSHILEEYAKNLGVLISEPIVAQHFFPLTENKYITIHSEDSIQSKHYKYFNIVLDLLRPMLAKENISVIQIDAHNHIINGINKAVGSLSFKQYAYIISKSIMHIAVDNVYSHYASSKNIPLISLFGNIYPSVSNGYWSKNKKDIAAPWKNKPCLSIQDPKSEINSIKPEQVAQAVLDLLENKQKVNFKTIHIGDMFLQPIYEVVPTSFHEIPCSDKDVLFLRADYGFDEIAFLQYCNNYKVAIITNELIQLAALEKIRHNVNKISVFLDKNSDEIPERYFEILKIWGVNIQILVKAEEDLGYLKNKYFDCDVHLYGSSKDKPANANKNCSFFSGKRIFKDGKSYASKAHFNLGKNIVDGKMNVIDTPEYWEEQDHHYYYEQN